VKLRCVMKKTGKGYVGECLELSLAVRENTPKECKEKLEQLIEDYIETIEIIYKEDKNIVLRPVALYPIKKIIFDINYYLCQRRKKDDCGLELIQTREIPVGI